MKVQTKYLTDQGLIRTLPTENEEPTYKEGSSRCTPLLFNGIPRETYLIHAPQSLDRCETPLQTSEPLKSAEHLTLLFAARVEFTSQVAVYIKRDLPALEGVLSFPAAYEVLPIQPSSKKEEEEEPDAISEFAWLFFDALLELKKKAKAKLELMKTGNSHFLAQSDAFVRNVNEMERRAAKILQHRLLVQSTYSTRNIKLAKAMSDTSFKENCLRLAAHRLKIFMRSNKYASEEFTSLSVGTMVSLFNSLVLAAIEIGPCVDLKSTSPFFRALFSFGVQIYPSYYGTDETRRLRVDEVLTNPLDQGETIKVLDPRTLARGICESVRGFSAKWLFAQEVKKLLQELLDSLNIDLEEISPEFVFAKKIRRFQ